MNYESKRQPIATRLTFTHRLFRHFLWSLLVVAFALSIGILGYHFVAGFGWVDALLDASMILGGMGPVRELPSDAAKLFASAYALFSGLVFISLTAILTSPVVHRILHHFHIDESDADPETGGDPDTDPHEHSEKRTRRHRRRE